MSYPASSSDSEFRLPYLIFAIASSEHFEAPSPPKSGDWYVLRVNGITIINAEIMKSVDAAISIFHVVIQNEGIYRFLYVSISDLIIGDMSFITGHTPVSYTHLRAHET